MSNALEIALRRAKVTKSLTTDAINRDNYIQDKINELRKQLDPICERLYNANKLCRPLTKPEQEIKDKLQAQKQELIEQINNLQKQRD